MLRIARRRRVSQTRASQYPRVEFLAWACVNYARMERRALVDALLVCLLVSLRLHGFCGCASLCECARLCVCARLCLCVVLVS